MGELSGGRSATWPTFFRSTSVRTRILLQNSQTVWTVLDQRKTILAPQFGQLATGWVIGRDSLGLRHKVLPKSLMDCIHWVTYVIYSRWIDTESVSTSTRIVAYN